jgi:hypothetical protein
MFYYVSQNKLVYKSNVGNVPLFEVSIQRSGKQELNTFIEKLMSHIELSQGRLTMQQRLAGELQYLRRIRDEARISCEQYELARGLIFRHKAYQTTQ